MKFIILESQIERMVIKTIKKFYEIKTVSMHFPKKENPDRYEIQVVLVLIPKQKLDLTPEIFQSSSRWVLSQPDSSGERALIKLSYNIWPNEESLPILTYIDDTETLSQYLEKEMEKEAIKSADEIDPNWNKYGSY